MKKQYIIPTIDVYEIKVSHQLLAGSDQSYDPTNPSSGDAGGAASRSFDFDDED